MNKWKRWNNGWKSDKGVEKSDGKMLKDDPIDPQDKTFNKAVNRAVLDLRGPCPYKIYIICPMSRTSHSLCTLLLINWNYILEDRLEPESGKYGPTPNGELHMYYANKYTY